MTNVLLSIVASLLFVLGFETAFRGERADGFLLGFYLVAFAVLTVIGAAVIWGVAYGLHALLGIFNLG